MKRASGIATQTAAYLLAVCGVTGWVAGAAEAVRSQLIYGYAVGRDGQPYKIWTVPLIVVGVIAAVGVLVAVLPRIERNRANVGRRVPQEITYPLVKRGRRARAGKRHRKS